jgi:uncharacterized protein YutE (UPF0331/DUF86 family)
MLERDAILSKNSIIKRCLETIKNSTELKPEKLNDYILQDVFILNIQRSVQACIDIANLLIAENGWQLPSNYKESFSILQDHNLIPEPLCLKMKSMCGFRNIAVHEYQKITPEILKSILQNHLKDFEEFYSVIFTKINNK